VPRSLRVTAGDGLPQLGELRYPLVLKPLTRLQETWSPLASAKVIQLDTAEELAEAWPLVAGAGVEVMIQEAIPGPESLVESYHAYVDPDGNVAADFTGRKLRTYPARHGYSTALVVTAASDVAELGREILRRIGFRGVAKVDFKRDPADGSLHLLEINPRFNLWHHLGARAGVNLPEIVYRDLVGLPRPRAGEARPGTRWISPWRDFVAARADGIGALRWLPWALSCEAKCAISWDDPLPFVGACAYRARRRLSRRSTTRAG
jgi:predicted ATP-grasp superfamily ATP-dependent carboligase